MEKITVCMTSYNGEKFILNQIHSILSQLENNDELIISDDGSTDNTLSIIKSINDKRIFVFPHTFTNYKTSKYLKNYERVAQNFENSLIHATGDIILLSDQDDIWSPNRIKRIKEELKTNMLVMVNYQVIDENNQKIGIIGYSRSPIYSNWFLNLMKSRFMCCCLAFRKELLPFILPFPKGLKSCDQWIGCNAAKYGSVKFLNDEYHLYRRHGKNVSYTSGKSKNSIYIRIKFRIDLLFLLLGNFLRKGQNNI